MVPILGDNSAEPQDPVTLRMVLGLSSIMLMSGKKFDGGEIGQRLRTTYLITVYIRRLHTKGTVI